MIWNIEYVGVKDSKVVTNYYYHYVTSLLLELAGLSVQLSYDRAPRIITDYVL